MIVIVSIKAKYFHHYTSNLGYPFTAKNVDDKGRFVNLVWRDLNQQQVLEVINDVWSVRGILAINVKFGYQNTTLKVVNL